MKNCYLIAINKVTFADENKDPNCQMEVKEYLNSKSKQNSKSDSKEYSIKEIDEIKNPLEEVTTYSNILFSSCVQSTPTPCNSVKKLIPSDNLSLHDYYQKKEDHQIVDYFKYSKRKYYYSVLS